MILSACTVARPNMSVSNETDVSKLAIIQTGNYGAGVQFIDGEPVGNFWTKGRFTSVYVDPGVHTLIVKGMFDATYSGGTGTASWMSAVSEITIDTKPQHTYVIYYEREGDKVRHWAEEKKPGYKIIFEQ